MSRALVVVDVQRDFCEGGSLAVDGGAQVAADVAALLTSPGRGGYDAVAATADWHTDPGAHWAEEPDYVDSWPVHCAAGTEGASFHPALEPGLVHVDEIFRKGQHAAAYSGFEGVSDDGESLASWLRARGVDEVDCVGIATDHCVRATALDAAEEGFRTRVLLDLTAGVAPGTTEKALAELRGAGVTVD